MIYPYITMSDETEITHSKLLKDGTVKIYIEKPVDGGFKNATFVLPSCRWEMNNGYNKKELRELETLIKNNAHLIMEYAKEGGFVHAATV